MNLLPPNLFVIGAPKAGTSSIVSDLSKVKDIYVPKIKEMRYFDANVFYDYSEDYPIKTYKEYLSYYDTQNAQSMKFRVDGSVFNMYSEKAIKNILSVSPEAKFILVVRDPVSSAKSMFLQRLKYNKVSMREVSTIFSKCWNLLDERRIGNGFPVNCRNKILFRYDLLYSYEKYVPKLSQLIPVNNLIIFRYETYCSKRDEIYKCLFEKLGLPSAAVPAKTITNPSFAKKQSVLNKMIDSAISKTSKFRHRLGLTGSRINNLSNIVAKFGIEEQVKVDLHDNEIRRTYKDTYNYLDSCEFQEVLMKNDGDCS